MTTTGERELHNGSTHWDIAEAGAVCHEACAVAQLRAAIAAQPQRSMDDSVSATRKDAETTHCSPELTPGVTITDSSTLAAPEQTEFARDVRRYLAENPAAQPMVATDGERRAYVMGYTDGKAAQPERARATAPVADDMARLDWLENAIWSETVCSNGIAIFPTVEHATKRRAVQLTDLGEEDGSNLGGEITGSHPTLRAAIDAARNAAPIATLPDGDTR